MVAKDLGLCKQKRRKELQAKAKDELTDLPVGRPPEQAQCRLWAGPGSDPRAPSSPVPWPALHLERALHISEFRERAKST